MVQLTGASFLAVDFWKTKTGETPNHYWAISLGKKANDLAGKFPLVGNPLKRLLRIDDDSGYSGHLYTRPRLLGISFGLIGIGVLFQLIATIMG